MIINEIGCENMYGNSKKIACPFGYHQRLEFEITKYKFDIYMPVQFNEGSHCFMLLMFHRKND